MRCIFEQFIGYKTHLPFEGTLAGYTNNQRPGECVLCIYIQEFAVGSIVHPQRRYSAEIHCKPALLLDLMSPF